MVLDDAARQDKEVRPKDWKENDETDLTVYIEKQENVSTDS